MTEPAPTPSTDAPQLAGMALQNGVLMLGPTSWAVAVRESDGQIHTVAALRPNEGEAISARVPLLRGPLRLANMVRVLPRMRRAAPNARLAVESRTVLATMAAGTVFAAQVRRRSGSVALAELASGAMSLALTLATMRSGEIASYHGAEHKAIAAHEQGIDAADASRVHPRCGTQLALPMLAFSAIGTQLALAAMPRNPRAARAVGQLAGIAAATELFRAASRGKATPVAALAVRAGFALQEHVTTSEPDRDQLDVAEAALGALLDAEAHAAA